MSMFALADTLMGIATAEAGGAALDLPPAAVIAFEFKLSTGKAVDLDTAGQEWRKAAAQVEKVCRDLQRSVAAISAQDWTADDRAAYEQKVQEFCSQLEVLNTYCMAVGIALTALAGALLVYALFAAGMGTYIAALAAVEIAAAASVVGSVSIPEILALAMTAMTITHVATGILASMGQLGAVAFGGGAAVSALVETGRGNKQALGDFMQAQSTASAASLATLAQNGANAGLDWLNRFQGSDLPGGAELPSGKAGLPLQSVDLDADRNFDHTWNIGDGASVKTGADGEHELGVHMKYGDRGLQGLDGEYKYTNHTGVSVGGKGGWEEDKDGHHSLSGGINGGYANGPSNLGTSGGVEGSYNTGNENWSGKGEGGVQYHGGDVYKESHEVNGDEKGTTWKHHTNSIAGDEEKPPWDL